MIERDDERLRVRGGDAELGEPGLDLGVGEALLGRQIEERLPAGDVGEECLVLEGVARIDESLPGVHEVSRRRSCRRCCTSRP